MCLPDRARPPMRIRSRPTPSPSQGRDRTMKADPISNTAPTAPNSTVNVAPTVTATLIERDRRAPTSEPVTPSRRYRPRYAGTRANPHGLKAATAPSRNAYAHQISPAREAQPLIDEEIRSTKITGTPPVVGEVSPAITAIASTSTVTPAASTALERDGPAATALAIASHGEADR